MGAEKYELLVSTLNKLPTLKENLTSKREELETAKRMVYSRKAEIHALQKVLRTRDSKIEKIEQEIEEIELELGPLEQEIAALKDNIKIEKKKVPPYPLRLAEAHTGVREAEKSWWNDQFNRWLAYTALGVGVTLYFGFLTVDGDDSMNCLVCVLLPVVGLVLASFVPHQTKVVIRQKDKLEIEWGRAKHSSKHSLHQLSSKLQSKNGKRSYRVGKRSKLRSKKESLIGLDNQLKEMNKGLDGLENSVSDRLNEIEYLEKEIEDLQNAIAPLIPYSDLLLDDE